VRSGGLIVAVDAYPEHEKLTAISDASQAIGEFLDWLSSEKSVHRMVWREWDEEFPCTDHRGWLRLGEGRERVCGYCGGAGESGVIREHHEGWVPLPDTVRALLAEYFHIDQDALEAEKRAMLAELRCAS
jgi:hypothetical protein